MGVEWGGVENAGLTVLINTGVYLNDEIDLITLFSLAFSVILLYCICSVLYKNEDWVN